MSAGGRWLPTGGFPDSFGAWAEREELELGFFRLEKRWLQGGLTVAFQNLRGLCGKAGEGLFASGVTGHGVMALN